MQRFLSRPEVEGMLSNLLSASISRRLEVGLAFHITSGGRFENYDLAFIGGALDVDIYVTSDTAFTVHTHWIEGPLPGNRFAVSVPSPHDIRLARAFGIPGLAIDQRGEIFAYGPYGRDH
jgi:hypothetical protein